VDKLDIMTVIKNENSSCLFRPPFLKAYYERCIFLEFEVARGPKSLGYEHIEYL